MRGDPADGMGVQRFPGEHRNAHAVCLRSLAASGAYCAEVMAFSRPLLPRKAERPKKLSMFINSLLYQAAEK
jgi:hypothetical protein